jgi:hypothetical protein
MYHKESQKKYYETHKEECMKRIIRRQVERYNTDPEYKEKILAKQRLLRQKKRDTLKQQNDTTLSNKVEEIPIPVV